MALQNFVDYIGPRITAAWLNAVDKLKFTVFDDADTKVEARVALTSDAPLEVINGGTGNRMGLGTIPQTAEELAAGIAPTDLSYQPGDVRRYGAVGDGMTDDYAAIQAALDTGHPVILQPVTYYITAGLTWTTDQGVIHANGAILTTTSDIVGLTIGELGASKWMFNGRIYGNLHLVNTGTSTKQGLLFQQCYEGNFEVSATGWERGIELTSDSEGCVYNAFHLGRIWNCGYGVYLNPTNRTPYPGGDYGWVNENNFYGGRFSTGTGATSHWHIYMADTDAVYGRPDNNKFYAPAMETAATCSYEGCYYDGGIQNSLLHARVETGNVASVIDIKIASTALCATIMFPYLNFVAGANQTILDEGESSIIFAVDQLRFSPYGNVSQPVLDLIRDDANTLGTPMVLFSDVYDGSQTSMGLLIEMARAGLSLSGTDYYLRGDNLGTVVGSGGLDYVCILSHTSSAAGAAGDEPGVGANWETYWRKLRTKHGASTTIWLASTSYTGTATKFRVNGAGLITHQTIRTGVAAPGTATANYVGELFVNTTGGTAWIAKAVDTGTDWIQIG